ncbi:DUF1127 domain-containing protein [Rhodobacteraceae bacterium]|nr:DUF1127 domain-containing protein [Paracoccaceae bacterium]
MAIRALETHAPRRSALRAALRLLTAWMSVRRTRMALRDLPPSLLDDIGVTREAADAEASRPFWH